nr:peptidylprolyl isomerase [Methylomarinum sp. Ch1-1]MDP4520718.1 peptidylprolyl isomerase [Methylomarinum sp. Ch1-1]
MVNGKYISKQSLQALENDIKQRSHGQSSFPKEQLIEELIQRELLVQEALEKKLDQSPEVVERLSTIKNSLLSQAALQNYLKSNPVTDDEIKAEYDSKMGNAGTEYKARHILVKSEEEAKQLIDELNKGADFVELAKSKSTGPSGPQGGDLGWFTADRMVAPFSEAVIAMENGKFSTEPVETQFGWHVILREDSRAQTPPPLEAVKEQIRPMLQRQKVQAMMENLRNQAKVEILLPASAEKAEAEPAAAAEATEQVETEVKSETTTEPQEPEAPASESEQSEEKAATPAE